MRKHYTSLASLIISLALLVPLFNGCAGDTADGNGTPERDAAMVQVVNDLTEMWNTMNTDMITDLYLPSFKRHSPTGDQTGANELKTLLLNTQKVYSDFKVDPHNIIIEGNKALVEYTISGHNTGPISDTTPATGKSFEVDGVSVIIVEDGKIAKETVYYNNLELLSKLGYTMQPPAVTTSE